MTEKSEQMQDELSASQQEVMKLERFGQPRSQSTQAWHQNVPNMNDTFTEHQNMSQAVISSQINQQARNRGQAIYKQYRTAPPFISGKFEGLDFELVD